MLFTKCEIITKKVPKLRIVILEKGTKNSFIKIIKCLKKYGGKYIIKN